MYLRVILFLINVIFSKHSASFYKLSLFLHIEHNGIARIRNDIFNISSLVNEERKDSSGRYDISFFI